MKRLFLLLVLLVASVGVLHAQGGAVTLGIKGGYNAIFGSFTATAVHGEYEAKESFAIDGGAQYNTIGRIATLVRPKYFHDFNFGRLSGEIMFEYSSQSRMSNYAIGCGASLDMRGVWVTIGYYHRTITLGADRVHEPFNIYYELGVRCLAKAKKWDLNLLLTNCELFELERHYQPSFAIEGWWHPTERLGIQAGVNYKPAGMFNISSEYYQIYGNVGVCYRW